MCKNVGNFTGIEIIGLASLVTGLNVRCEEMKNAVLIAENWCVDTTKLQQKINRLILHFPSLMFYKGVYIFNNHDISTQHEVWV